MKGKGLLVVGVLGAAVIGYLILKKKKEEAAYVVPSPMFLPGYGPTPSPRTVAVEGF